MTAWVLSRGEAFLFPLTRQTAKILLFLPRCKKETCMSGHSKWATTKHKKAAIDAKRSSLFSKLSRNITVAAKSGGDPNPDNNATLAAAVARARMVSMPNAKIKAAIDKAFGAGADAAVYEEISYEGYGPAGVAVYVDCLTDNKNRTAADVRSAFSHAGGNLGTSGSVAFQFERKGSIAVEKIIKSDDKKVADRENAVDEDEFMMAVAEAEGDDYEDAGDQWIVYTAYDKMQDVQKGLEAQGIEVKGSELTMIATTPTEVSVADAKKVQRLVDRLEELEDVQNVYDTMNRTDEIEEALAADE
ncbi:DNA-binding regulatory protein, YebC/PmpR family [Atopobium sp. oral taxon 810 str. F0209]|nr:DNA-binding regulatory protein, YebC/PmpR family [Atopobium sp. oral taxon 810 str. F0209]